MAILQTTIFILEKRKKMYKIVNIDTDEVLREVETPPSDLGKNEILIEVSKSGYEMAIETVNKAARNEILDGYLDSTGVKYGLSETDQLNYTASAAMAGLGYPEIEVIGEFNGDRYYKTVLSNAEAKVFFGNIFSYVASILKKYRDIKSQVYTAIENGEDPYSILKEAGIKQ